MKECKEKVGENFVRECLIAIDMQLNELNNGYNKVLIVNELSSYAYKERTLSNLVTSKKIKE